MSPQRDVISPKFNQYCFDRTINENQVRSEDFFISQILRNLPKTIKANKDVKSSAEPRTDLPESYHYIDMKILRELFAGLPLGDGRKKDILNERIYNGSAVSMEFNRETSYPALQDKELNEKKIDDLVIRNALVAIMIQGAGALEHFSNFIFFHEFIEYVTRRYGDPELSNLRFNTQDSGFSFNKLPSGDISIVVKFKYEAIICGGKRSNPLIPINNGAGIEATFEYLLRVDEEKATLKPIALPVFEFDRKLDNEGNLIGIENATASNFYLVNTNFINCALSNIHDTDRLENFKGYIKEYKNLEDTVKNFVGDETALKTQENELIKRTKEGNLLVAKPIYRTSFFANFADLCANILTIVPNIIFNVYKRIRDYAAEKYLKHGFVKDIANEFKMLDENGNLVENPNAPDSRKTLPAASDASRPMTAAEVQETHGSKVAEICRISEQLRNNSSVTAVTDLFKKTQNEIKEFEKRVDDSEVRQIARW